MKVIFDVGHPAQVHNFKHVYWELTQRGWQGLFTAKEKEMTLILLKKYNLPYVIIGKSGNKIFVKIANHIKCFFNFFRVLIKFRPDLVVCRFSLHATWCSGIFRIPVIGLADTEYSPLNIVTTPFASVKLTGESYEKNLGKNHLRFKGNIELFYLHPNRYRKPEIPEGIEKKLEERKYVLIRFVSWSAAHDFGEKGISEKDKEQIISLLESKYDVYISSENKLPPGLMKYRLNIGPEKIHDFLAKAELYVGEGASMASEAACLGVPSIYVNTLVPGSIKEEANSGLVYIFNHKDIIVNLNKLINDSELKRKTQSNLKLFLKDKIDPTAFLVWFIENWPQSLEKIKQDPCYQYNFK